MTTSAAGSDQTPKKLVISDGSGSTRTIFLTRDLFSIGRELDNDISLDDLGISRYHAHIKRRDERFFVEDLASANGTTVNGVVISEPRILRTNDTIGIGSYDLRFDVVSDSVPAVVVPPPSATPPRVQAIQVAQPAARSRKWWLWLLAGAFVAALVLLIVLVVGGWLYIGSESTVAEATATTPITLDVPTIELTQAPANNSRIRVNQSITIQAIATDPSGVARMELWVNDRKVDEVSSSLAQNTPSMAAAFQWAPSSAGTYNLELRAFNQRELGGVLPVSTLIAIGDTPSPTPTDEPTNTPTPTVTPVPPTPTSTKTPTPTPVPSTPTPLPAELTVNAPQLNVRLGPGTQYGRVGQLQQGDRVEITGQATAAQGQWWRIDFPSAPGGLGWVAGSSTLVNASNVAAVPVVVVPPTPTPRPTARLSPTPTPTATVPPAEILRAPAGKTLLIISNRSAFNQPARLTLSGGKSVGGGKEFDPPPNGEIQVVLEPDFYRALWSSPARGGFVRGVDFTAVPGKVVVMWIVPEEGLTETEVYDQLTLGAAREPKPGTGVGADEAASGYAASPGKALFVAGNRSALNNFVTLTLSGGNFAGGQQFTLDANTETPLDMLPGDYRATWHSPTRSGFNVGRDFSVTAGEVVVSWIIPEDRQVFLRFSGQPPSQITN